MNINVMKNNEVVELIIAGDATIEFTPELQANLFPLLTANDELILNLNELNSSDTAFFQLIYSFAKQFNKKERQLKIKDDKGVFDKLVSSLGSSDKSFLLTIQGN